MQALPVRLFHACLSGLFAGTIIALFIFHIQGRFLDKPELPPTITDIGPSPNPAPEQLPVATDPPANPNDRDNDGIPNDWEVQFHHDPDKTADAGSDFDNDGLTALQEYQLYQQTSGVSGNPLGKWASETLQPPAELGIQYFYPQDINRNGEILLNAGMITDGEYHDGSIFVDQDRNWTVIRNPDSPSADYIWCSDLNDMGTVVGGWSSYDWTAYEGFKWSVSGGYEVLTLGGDQAFPNKINNHGDWVGSIQESSGNWRPAYVVDGINMHSDKDWWPYVWYQDINDFGEALGTYYSADYNRQHAFLAYGPWLYDTGLEGAEPEFDSNHYSYLGTNALNAWGEFTAGAGGNRNGTWTTPGYIFDGEFSEIESSRLAFDYLYPFSISDDKTVTGYASDSSVYGFIHRDGVTLRCSELVAEANGYYLFISGDRRIIASTSDQQSVIIITPDQDKDGDGMPDDWEDFYGSDKNSAADASGDADGDGTNNLGEFLLRSDPNAAPVTDPNGQTIDLRPGIDTDGDGIPNVWEWQNGLAYDDPSDAPLDYDRDGYSNLQEYHLNTDPRGAPSYRMRVIGPFPGASGANLQSTVIGDGIATGNATYLGGNITETVQFPASPDASGNNGQRPASWSVPRSGSTGAFSISSTLSNTYCSPVVHSPSGASLYYRSANPIQFYYWPSTTAQPVTLSGAANENDISYLHNARISPSGTFVVGQRYSVSTGSYQPVVWKMPTSPTTTYKPIRLVPPSGASIWDWATLYVNDHGYVLANGSAFGQSRPILWKVSADGTAVTASILPPLPGSNWANATGISNQNPPLISGTSSASNQQRAVVWTSAGAVTNLGTLTGGNFSSASLISRGGSIAGISNVLVGNTLKQQPFLATYVAATSSWKLLPQGEPSANYTQLTSVNDFGEILGTTHQYTPTYRQIRTLWRHGRAYPIESCFSGALLDNATQLSPHGTLLATVSKEGSSLTVLLTPDRDTDNDGLPDAYENQHGFNAFVKNSPSEDSDSDELTDLDEFRNNTDPRKPDTDDDGMKDGFEVSWGLLPLDPTDAPLDPDNDRVTNLRESQIGTTPTGIYKVETRLSGESWNNCGFHAASDTGQIVFGANSTWNSYTDENGLTHNEFSQQFFALPPVDEISSNTPMPLPGYHDTYSYNSDWTEYSGSGDYVSYFPDQSANRINVTINRYSYDSSQGIWDEWFFLIPDVANNPDESTWLQWSAVEENLRNLGFLQYDDFLHKYPDAVSPSGTYRIHHSNNSWEYFILNESGEFIDRLTFYSPTWFVNDSGIAAGLETSYYDSDWNWVENSPRIHLSTGETIPIPNEPGTTAYFSLLRFSNDGKALLSKQIQNEQLAYVTQHFLFDTVSGSLTRLRQPGFGNETIDVLSNQNGRILGNGPKPFQITPDGTCIRLDALRIKNSPTSTPVPFGTLYPQTLTPNHIASNGRITLTTTNSQNQQVILQITPHNDANNNGLPDDWEIGIHETIKNTYGAASREYTTFSNLVANGLYNADSDFDGDGFSASDELDNGTSDGNASDSFGTEDNLEENYDDVILRTRLEYLKWYSSNKKVGFDAFPVQQETTGNGQPDADSNQSIPRFFLKKTRNESSDSQYFDSNTHRESEFVQEWNPNDLAPITKRDYASGNWTNWGDSGQWTLDNSPELETPISTGEVPPDGAGVPPPPYGDIFGGTFVWSVTENDTGWRNTSPTNRKYTVNGSWESIFWDGQEGSWSDDYTENLENEYLSEMLIDLVDKDIEKKIIDYNSLGYSVLRKLNENLTSNEITYLLEVSRSLSEDEKYFSASVADWRFAAYVSNHLWYEQKKRHVGWYEGTKDNEGNWTCSLKIKKFEPNSTPNDYSLFERGEITRLQAEGNNQTRALCAVQVDVGASFPSTLEINGMAGDQGGSGGTTRTTNDAQIRPCAVYVGLGDDMTTFLSESFPSELENKTTMTQIGGEGKVRIYKRSNPSDQTDHTLEQLHLPLRFDWSDPVWNDLYVEGATAGLVKLGVTFTTPAGLRVVSVRSIRVAPYVEATTIVPVNDQDQDGDGFPGFADGFTDMFADTAAKNMRADDSIDFGRFGDEVWKAKEFNFYINEWNNSVFTQQATIRFDYDASDPTQMELIPVDETGSRVKAATGKLRLWKAYTDYSRSAKGLEEGGDYVKSGVQYSFDHGSYFAVEAIEASKAVNDLKVKVTIDPDGPGPVAPAEREFGFTAVGMSVHEIMPNSAGGTGLQRRLTAPLSYPAPKVEETGVYLDVRNIQHDAVKGSIVGDLDFPFTVSSDALNVIESELIKDPKVYLCVNGEPETDDSGNPIEIPLNRSFRSQPQGGTLDLRKPFDRTWNGHLQKNGVRLLEGTNTVELLAVDMVHGYRGSLKYNFEVQALPGPSSEPDDESYSGYTFFSPPTNGAAIVKVGGGEFRPYTLRLDAPDEILQTAGNLAVNYFDVAENRIPIVKYGPSYFMGARSAWQGPVVYIDIPKMLPSTEGAGGTQAVVAEDGFETLDPESDSELGSLKAARQALDVNRDGDVNALDVMTDLKRLTEQHQNDRLELRFYAGFFKGFVGNPCDAIKDTVGIGIKLHQTAISYALKNPGETAFYLIFPPAAVNRLGYEAAVCAQAAGQRFHKWYVQNQPQIQKLSDFLCKLTSSGEDAVFEFLITGQLPGDDGGVDELPEEWRVVIDAIAIVYAGARDHWLNMSPEERGYVFGYVSFEIAAAAVGTFVTAVSGGAAAPVLGAKIASTMRLVYSILGKLKKASKLAGPIDEILKALNPVVRRMCTAGCFAAGTLVATSSGLLAIEQIEAGMEVWAWDAKANTARLCKVEETFSNPPLPVWRMDYDLDGDRISDGHLVATKDHPIWAENAGQYMPISELKEGYRLRLLGNVRYAEVISIQRETENQATFNMRVAELHNYFAGDEAILTHNTFCKNIDSWSDGVKKLITESQKKWDEYRRIPGYKHWGDLWQKSSNGDLSRYRGHQAAKLQALFNDELDDFIAKGTINGRKSKPTDCPGIPGIKEPEQRMIEKIRKYHHENMPRTDSSPGEGWVKANPLEYITSKNGPDGKALMDFEKFDCLVDEVKSEIFHPKLDGNLADSIYKKIQDCKSMTKNAKRLYVELDGLEPSARDQLIQIIVVRRDGRSELQEIELYFSSGNTFIEKIYGQ